MSSDLDLHLNSISVSRQVFNADIPIDLCVFVDASTQAYGFCCYAVQSGTSNLVLSKVKLAPLTNKSLPTLELLSAFLALQCVINFISDNNFNVKIQSIKLLTDSQVSLSWLLSGSALRKNTFVNNRLKDIKLYERQLSDKDITLNYLYVPTKDNIADIFTRPCTMKDFLEKQNLWFHGPSWLNDRVDSWPTGTLGCIPSQFSNLIANVNICPQPDFLIDVENFSSYSRLIGVLTKVFVAKNKFLKKDCSLDDAKSQAFQYLVRMNQEQHYSDVLKFLNDETKNSPLIVSQLNLFVDSCGIIRSRGRVSKSSLLSYDSINPVLINQNSHLSKLLIKHAHFQCKHLGTNFVLNYLRQGGMWIPKARAAINSVKYCCLACHDTFVEALLNKGLRTAFWMRCYLIDFFSQFYNEFVLDFSTPFGL